MKLYKGFEEAKNGTVIPVFASGRTMESRYNPQRDAENLLASISGNEKFFLVLGIGSGLFIEGLLQNKAGCKIIALELFNEDIDFLKQSQTVKKLSENPSVIFTSLENVKSVLIENYIPSKYGDLKIIEQRAWINENQEHIERINELLKNALGIISADYSVQAHFGKIWNSNILNNAKTASQLSLCSLKEVTQDQLDKTAAIIAAGPTLDKTIEILSQKNSRENYFIIATDTAGQVLLRNGIIPEVIVSIDGQSVSYNHFMKAHKAAENKPLYAFDLCSNSSAVRHIASLDNRIMFFCSGHPLAAAINSCCGSPLPLFFSGAGTVTITAIDMAVQAGFKKITILGADFSYSKGKAYACGTYLDILYNLSSSRITDSEQSFSKLMYRTELLGISENIYTTPVLEAYRTSLEKYLEEKNIRFIKKDDIYELKSDGTGLSLAQFSDKAFSLEPFFKKINEASLEETETLLLPYIAWLRHNEQFKGLEYKELLKLALDSIVSYNI